MKIALVRSLAAAVLLAGLTACQNTTLESAWKAPEVGSLNFTKVLVIGIAPVDSLRRPLEDAMKAEIKAVPAVASYELLPDVKDQVDPKKVAAVIKANAIDGIIALRMVAFQDDVTYHPGGLCPCRINIFPRTMPRAMHWRPITGAGGRIAEPTVRGMAWVTGRDTPTTSTCRRA
ncbi:MAG: hypothetical protein WDM96_18070 [Lacunisphaera sp.]